jgi:type IV pilus assembly protein PilE
MRHPGLDARGFSLAELALVLMLTALLAWIGARSWQDLARSQRRAEGRAALARTMQFQERHFSLHGRYREYAAGDGADFPSHSGPTPEASSYRLSAVACADAPLEACVLLRADARFHDPECGTLMLDSRGRQGAQGEGARCW